MNALKIAFIVLFLLVTTLTLATNPKLHKSVVIGDLDYTTTTPKITSTPVTVQPQKSGTAVQQIKTQKQPQQKVIVQVIEEHVKTAPKNVTTSSPAKQQKVVVNQHSQLVNRVVKNVENTSKPQTKTVTTAPKTNTTQVKPIKVQKKVLTEQEEIIAWNKWRSDLQNKVMMDSNIAAPMGTTFHFTCTVDKNGNVSNVNTWSDNTYYTPMAKRIIKPVLVGYQYTPILNFPTGTKRTIVNVTGQFTMANVNKYSTPGDYSDYERVKR